LYSKIQWAKTEEGPAHSFGAHRRNQGSEKHYQTINTRKHIDSEEEETQAPVRTRDHFQVFFGHSTEALLMCIFFQLI
jgi:hypothetical protein